MAAPIDRLRGAMADLDGAAATLADGEERIALRAAWIVLASAEQRIARQLALAADRAARREANRAANGAAQEQFAAARLAHAGPH